MEKTEKNIKINTSTEWTHDDCGGKVDTSGLYWICKRCGQFVYVAVCNGNSKAIESLSKFIGKRYE